MRLEEFLKREKGMFETFISILDGTVTFCSRIVTLVHTYTHEYIDIYIYIFHISVL